MARRRLNRDEQEARLEALHAQLTEAVSGLVSSEDWRRALEFATHFRARSFNNVMLIHLQHAKAYTEGRVPDPYPTYVAGYVAWKSLGRIAKPGGYMIYAPVRARFASLTPADPDSWRRLGKYEKPSPGEAVRRRVVGMRHAYVWDVSLTEGDPIPEPPRPVLLEGEAPQGLWNGLAAQIEARGFTVRPVPHAEAIGGANGLTDFLAREVSVRTDMDAAAQVKTLAHELGHVLLHGPDNASVNRDAARHRGIAEVEAESIALMVGAAHGLDTSGYTIPYVASWASGVDGTSPVEVVQATAERVRGAAVSILNQLDTTQVGDGDPPGLDKEALAGAPRRRAQLGADRTRAAGVGEADLVVAL